LATSSRRASAPVEAERVERDRLLLVDRLLPLVDRLLELRPPLELRLLPEVPLLELRLLPELLRPLPLLRPPELRVLRRPLPELDPPDPLRLACAMVPPSID
jgi:hypothetical protein